MFRPRVLLLLLSLLVLAVPGTATAVPGAGPIPVTADDPARGNPTAPVTLVVFTELQCPYCARLHPTLEALSKQYGPDKLRVIYKHRPLGFHTKARPAAEAAVAVRSLGGDAGFFRFFGEAFAAMQQGGDHRDALATLGIPEARVERVLATGAPAKKVDADMALGDKLGVRGVPASFINGVLLSGAQPLDAFAKVIDEQLEAARALRGKGVSAARLYDELSRQNFTPPAAPSSGPAGGSTFTFDTTVWNVPVGTSPRTGPADAPVTLVVFSDFECPFCARLVPTLQQVQKEYGNRVRVVFKHNPLSFHANARPAAAMSAQALRVGSHAGFWKMHDRLFAQHRSLTRPDLEALAQDMGLPANFVDQALDGRHDGLIDDDIALARSVGATGTPATYINGRKVSGAVPIESFRQAVDEELAHAAQLRKSGVAAAQLYAHIIQSGKTK